VSLGWVVDVAAVSEAVAGLLASGAARELGQEAGGGLAAGMVARVRAVFGPDARSVDALEQARREGTQAAVAELAVALAWYARRDHQFARELAGWVAQAGSGSVNQRSESGRDTYNAGRDQTVVNYRPRGDLYIHHHDLRAAGDAKIRDALDQLSSGQVSVHAGALGMLEQAAQADPGLRQYVVDVFCAYLRESAPPAGSPQAGNWQRTREICQRILASHLRPAALDLKKKRPRASSTFWRDIDLRLMEALLHDLDLSGCYIRSARFDGAIFTGHAQFHDTLIHGPAVFANAVFHGPAEFMGSEFTNHAWFTDARFMQAAIFGAMASGGPVLSAAVFHGNAWFRGARFAGSALFNSAQFSGEWNAAFEDADFAGDAWFMGTSMKYGTFDGTTFRKSASFYHSQFGELWLRGTVFCGDLTFEGVTSGKTIYLHQGRLCPQGPQEPKCVLPPGWALRPGSQPGCYAFAAPWPEPPGHLGLIISPVPHI
jgi:uncharacterized protein YjbI with pentapeptide repeats